MIKTLSVASLLIVSILSTSVKAVEQEQVAQKVLIRVKNNNYNTMGDSMIGWGLTFGTIAALAIPVRLIVVNVYKALGLKEDDHQPLIPFIVIGSVLASAGILKKAISMGIDKLSKRNNKGYVLECREEHLPHLIQILTANDIKYEVISS